MDTNAIPNTISGMYTLLDIATVLSSYINDQSFKVDRLTYQRLMLSVLQEAINVFHESLSDKDRENHGTLVKQTAIHILGKVENTDPVDERINGVTLIDHIQDIEYIMSKYFENFPIFQRMTN